MLTGYKLIYLKFTTGEWNTYQNISTYGRIEDRIKTFAVWIKEKSKLKENFFLYRCILIRHKFITLKDFNCNLNWRNNQNKWSKIFCINV